LSDLDELITAVLVEKAEPVRLPADTAARARTRANHTRRRGQWAAAATCALAVVVIAGGVAEALKPAPSALAGRPPKSVSAPCSLSLLVDGRQVWTGLASRLIDLPLGHTVQIRLATDPASPWVPCSLDAPPPVGHNPLTGIRNAARYPIQSLTYRASAAGSTSVEVGWARCRAGTQCPAPEVSLATVTVDVGRPFDPVGLPCTATVLVDGKVQVLPPSRILHIHAGQQVRAGVAASSIGTPCQALVSDVGDEVFQGRPRVNPVWTGTAVGEGRADIVGSWDGCPACHGSFPVPWTIAKVVVEGPAARPTGTVVPPCTVSVLVDGVSVRVDGKSLPSGPVTLRLGQALTVSVATLAGSSVDRCSIMPPYEPNGVLHMQKGGSFGVVESDTWRAVGIGQAEVRIMRSACSAVAACLSPLRTVARLLVDVRPATD
jgi:hypothetical protein